MSTYLKNTLKQIPFVSEQEKGDFLKELELLKQGEQTSILYQASLIPQLYTIYTREIAKQNPIAAALSKEAWLQHYFQQLLGEDLRLPEGNIALQTFLDLIARGLKEDYLTDLLKHDRLGALDTERLQNLQGAYLANAMALTQFLMPNEQEMSADICLLGIDTLLLLYPGLIHSETAQELRNFLINILPFYVKRFAHRMEQTVLLQHTDRVAEWFLLWERHQSKQEENIPEEDPYYEMDFPLIIKYVPEYIWWNNGLIYRNNDKNYHFGSPGFRHLALGGSVRKAPDARPYTRRMAREFVNLPYDFPHRDWDLYIYLFTRNLGADGLLAELLQEYIRHPEDVEELSAIMNQWNPIIQKLATEDFNQLPAGTGRELLSYLYHCVRDQPSFSIQGRTLNQLLQASEAFHTRIQARAHQRAVRAQEEREAYEAHLKKRVTWNWEASKHISSFESGSKAHGNYFIIRELTSELQLQQEGAVMHHCVGTYADLCRSGHISIWSLRQFRNQKWYSVVTIEVNRNAIVQARAAMNANPIKEHKELIEKWARKEQLVWRERY